MRSIASGRGIWLGIALSALCAVAAQAQDAYGRSGGRSDTGPLSVHMGLGFTAGPSAFLLGFEADYLVFEQVSLGGLVQLALDDDYTIVSPVAYGRYWVDLGQYDAELDPLVPYLQTGLGFTWWERDLRFGRDDDDTAFLINFGFGAEYRFTPHLALGSQMLFNFIPTEIFDDRAYDDHFYYSWEVLGLRYRF